METKDKIREFVDTLNSKWEKNKDEMIDIVQDNFYLFLFLGATIIGIVIILLIMRRRKKNKDKMERHEEEKARYGGREWKWC